VSAILYSPEVHISTENLIGIAQATGNVAVANFLQQTLSGSMVDEELRQNFLMGEPSPLRFLIENKVLKLDIFQIEVLKFHPDDSDIFYKNLVWTFQHMSGGGNLPDRVEPMLKQLFSAGFTPTTSFQSGTHSGIESRSPLEKTGRLGRENQPLPREKSKSEENTRNLPNRSQRYPNAPFSAQSSFVGVEVSTTESRSPLEKTGRLGRENQPLPREKSKSEENTRNNLPNRSQRYPNAPFSAQSSFVGVEVSTTDKARSRAMKLVQVKEINTKFVPVSVFPQCKSANSDDATQPMYHRFVSLMSPPVSSFQYQSGTGTDSSRSSSLAGSSYNPDSAIGSPGATPPSSRPQGNSGIYLSIIFLPCTKIAIHNWGENAV
jgi:hypothetical protein